jgi:ABC-type Fe3+-hydroxamate transport system substrate-binding protein
MGLRKITDALGRELLFGPAPRRIVSLVPSDTLSVFDLGCGAALVGRTDYCELPEAARALPSVGGTKNPDLAKIRALEPDLVLANKEENTKRDLERLAQDGYRVLVAFPRRVAEGLAHLAKLAAVLDVAGEPAVKDLVRRGYEAVREADAARAGRIPVPTFCPIWMDPLMTIHGDTYISDALHLAGAENVFADRARRYPLAADLGQRVALTGDRVRGRDTRYPRVTTDEVVRRAPDLVLLPDEPHPFSLADREVFLALDLPASRTGAVVRTSRKDLCGYGSRAVDGLARLRALVAPHARPAPAA